MRTTKPAFVLAALLVSSVTALALPKFAARTGAKCISCHVNPTGQGMRTEFGQSYGRDDLPMPTFKEATDFDEFSTSLTPNFSIGGDFRSIFDLAQSNSASTFFQMEGNLYLDFRLNKKFRVYLNKGLYSGFEVMGIAKVLPLDGYIKIGKFTPAYGTRVDDHTSFIRSGPESPIFIGPYSSFSGNYVSGLRFGKYSEDNGIEVGLAPNIFTFTLGVFNGQTGSGLTGITPSLNKTVALRGDAMIKMEHANLNIGGSLYNSPSPNGRQMYYGAFGSLGLFESISLNGEADIVELHNSGVTTTGFMIWSELNCMVIQGIDLKLGYQFYDPDRSAATGSFTRLTVGAEFFLLSGVEVRPIYYFNLEQPTEIGNNNELLLMTHFYF